MENAKNDGVYRHFDVAVRGSEFRGYYAYDHVTGHEAFSCWHVTVRDMKADWASYIVDAHVYLVNQGSVPQRLLDNADKLRVILGEEPYWFMA